MQSSYSSLSHLPPHTVTPVWVSVKRDELSSNPGTELKWKSLSTRSVSCDVSAGGNSKQEDMVTSSSVAAAL